MSLFQNDLPAPPTIFPKSEGYSFEYDAATRLFHIKVPDGELIYSESFFEPKISDRSINYLLENRNGLDWRTTDWRAYEQHQLAQIAFTNIKWQHDTINMFGKRMYLPRYTAWYGDGGKSYTYSGITMQPEAWNKGLLYIKEQVEKIAAQSFNSVLLNWYRDGNDKMGWHADDEPELGQNPVIASVNFGATRRFLLRRNADHKEKLEFSLKHGSLLIMKGTMQHHWQHTVPKEAKVKEDRINLTFRQIK